jgi:two-component system, NarL family, sensor histidine kinase UhpB
MQHLSIQSRLNALIGALLILALATNVLVIVWSAGPRIRAENESILTLTRQTVARGLAEMRDAPDPAPFVSSLLNRLSDVRHVRVTFEPAVLPTNAAPTAPHRPNRADRNVPTWFFNLLTYDRIPVRVPVVADDALYGTIVIASHPGDEILEIWEAVTETLTGGLALIAAVFALTTVAVQQAVLPIKNLTRALGDMETGNYEVELAAVGPPEFAPITAKLNDLAAALTRTRRDNTRLAGQIINIEDQERRELARELHDEFGPYLFAIRATISSLMKQAETAGGAFAQDVRRKGETTLAHVNAVQQLNRRVLQRLRPPALAELGLEGALSGLIALWRENNPGIAISIAVDLDDQTIDDTTQLTVYRVVQEGLTNAQRHAAASKIDVRITVTPTRQIQVTIADDGKGLSDVSKPGFGLSGMAERVWALGGVMNTGNGAGGGFVLNVALPASMRSNAVRSEPLSHPAT